MVGRGPGTVSAVALLAVLCAVAVSPVLAQDADSLPDVADRYEGTGMHAGSFWLLPTLESGLFYDSNIYARNRNIRDGIGTYVAPRLELHSDWGLHELNVELGASQYVYFDDPELNKTNVDGSIDGRIDLRRDLVLLGGVKGGHFEQGLGDTNTNSLAAEPTRHEEGEAWASINKAFNRLSVSVGGGYHFYDYHDVDSILGGVIDQDFRDGDVFETGGRVSYAISPGTRVFGDFRYNWRDYRGGGADSDGWRGLTGLEFEMSRLMRGEIGVGYMEQYYGAGPDSSGISYHAGLTWNPTPLMTVKLDADRKIEDSAVLGASGSVSDSAKLTVDYEVRRGVVLTPSASITHLDYIGSGAESLSFDLGANLEYTMNRFMSVGMSYAYTVTGQSGLANDFDRHVIGVYAKARF